MSVSITEALQQAQESIGSGNYRGAISTCSRLVQQFPHYAAAHRLLGEAWLEQGQNAEAERAFAAALSGNPRHPWAYLGLGLIAEDRGANDPALAFTQVAWELAPHLPQFREPVRRSAQRRYGADGQLQLTRAALAQLHADNARLQRAAAEYRAALAELPDRIDLQLGYAEVLWRLGQDAEAAGLCREIVEHHPDAVQALVILAEIEHRGGDARRADDWLARVRAVDPDGGVVGAMLAGNPKADAAWLGLSPEALPAVSDEAAAPAPDMPHIAPAPDFEYVPSRPETRAASMADLKPMDIQEFGGEPVAAAAEVEPSLLMEDFGEQPFDLSEHLPGVEADSGLLAEDFSEQPFDLGALGEAEEAEPSFAEIAGGLGLAAFGEHEEPQTVEAEAPAAMDDELSSLAAALEGDVADALSRSGGLSYSEDAVSDEPADNLPPEVAPSGYTTMLNELGAEGLAPFDALDQSMPAPDLSDDLLAAELAELAGEAPAVEPQAAPIDAPGSLDAIASEWDAIDTEIQAAVPAEMPGGFTDELRSLEGIGLEPFEVDLEAEAPAAALAEMPTAELDELWLGEAPSRQTAEAEPVETVIAEAPAAEIAPGYLEAQPEPEPEVVAAPPALDEAAFADLEPFAVEDFDQGPSGPASKPFSFGPAPWDAGQEGVVRSVVPSDEDLEELLAAEEAARNVAGDVVTTEIAAPAAPEPVIEAVAPPAEPVVEAPEPMAAPAVEAEMEAVEASVAPVAEAEMEAFNTDELPTANLPSGWEPPVSSWSDQEQLEDMFGSSLAVTRALGANEEPPSPYVEPAPAVEAAAPAIDEIGSDAGVFDRARAAKSELIEEGVITGNLELAGAAAAELEALVEPEPAPEPAPAAAPEPEALVDETARVAGTGAFRDVDTLRAALAADPSDAEMHWWLAEALRQRGDTADAVSEYRWLVRNAPDRVDAVAAALSGMVDRDAEPELAHRMLADIYRRRGDVARSSRHAAMALQLHRRRG